MKKILNRLIKLEIFLLDVNEYHWSKEINQAITNIKENGYTGDIRNKILSWYGNMGSLNDLYLCPENDFDILKGDVEKANKKFRKLISEIYLICLNR